MEKAHGRVQDVVALGMLVAVMLLACCACAFALDPSLDVNQYAHSAWKIRDGFTQGSVVSIAQTSDGYLWLGTEFGLLRFDGVHALPWQPPGNQHVPTGTIRSLFVSRDGTLWIGARGLASWKNGKLTEYPEFAQIFVYSIIEDHEGTVWVGGGGIPFGRLCAIRGSVHCFGDDGRFDRWVAAVYEDHNANLWLAVKDGIWKWKPGPPKYYSLPGNPDSIYALGEDGNGGLLVGWKGTIYRLIDGKTEKYSQLGALPQFQTRTIFRDRDGGLWIGTYHRGLVHIHQQKIDVLSQVDGLSGDDVLGIFEDREGNIWVSTVEGLDRFRDYAVATLTVKQGLSGGVVGSVLADKDGSVWFATTGGLNWRDHEKITIPRAYGLTAEGKINGNDPSSLFQDDRGRIWISTVRELGYLENGRFTSIKGIPGGQMLSIAQDAAGDLWVINEDVGLFRISPSNDVRKIPWSALGHKDHASVLAADRTRGGLWIGFYLGGLAYLSNGQVRATYTAVDGLGAGRVSDFQFDDDGALWISTEGGLSRFKNNHLATLTSNSGLPCNAVAWAMKDNDHSWWLYTACGLVRIDRQDLHAWAASVDNAQVTTRLIPVTIFGNSDGVRNIASPSHYHPQVAKTQDGKLWFFSLPGVSVIDPHHISFNKVPPPVHIEQIIADRKTYDAASQSGSLRLPRNVRDLEIDYTALSLVAPETIRFRYKLEGRDGDWKEAGNRRQAFYTDLPPRNYTFRVKASNNSGVWNEAGTSLEFSVAPAYYQTLWFRSLCVIAFLALLAALYQLRLQQVARQFNMRMEERVNERTRVARDLHDTLLQSFQGVLLKFHAVTYMLTNQPEAERELEAVIEQARQAVTEGRDTVYGLRFSDVPGNDVARALSVLGEELAANQTDGNRAAFRVHVEGVPRNLAPVVCDEIYRLGCEALRNAFRHAHAERIELEIRYDQRQFRLRVRDNGKGIDPKILGGDEPAGHYGLPGMHERAKLVGGKFAVWSKLDSGTEAELSIPASVAYAKSPAPRPRMFSSRGA